MTTARKRPRGDTPAGHRCPHCRQSWALVALRNDAGFVVACRYCDYLHPVVAFGQAGPAPAIPHWLPFPVGDRTAPAALRRPD